MTCTPMIHPWCEAPAGVRLSEPSCGPGGPVPGDLDGDVDLVDDYAIFYGRMSGQQGGLLPGCEAADLDGDNDVDRGDFAAFAENFTG